MITPRRAWAPDGRDPAWKSDGVTPRPALQLPLGLVIVHYTGAGATYVGKPVEPALEDIYDWAFGIGEKGDEYNYVIGWDGSRWEWAGPKQAAHCSNKNTTSIGVLLLLGIGEAPTDAMVDAFQDLRRELVDNGTLTDGHGVDRHGQHFATSCPGTEVENQWARFDIPLEPAPPPPSGDAVPFLIAVTNHPGYNPRTEVVYVCDWLRRRWVQNEEWLAAGMDQLERRAVDYEETDLEAFGILTGEEP